MKNNSTLDTICYGLINLCLILPIKICIGILLLPVILLASCLCGELEKGWKETFGKR